MAVEHLGKMVSKVNPTPILDFVEAKKAVEARNYNLIISEICLLLSPMPGRRPQRQGGRCTTSWPAGRRSQATSGPARELQVNIN